MARFLMSRDEYARRYIIGRYTPRLPTSLTLARRRSYAVKRGRCIECCKNEREGDYTHCRPCLDHKKGR